VFGSLDRRLVDDYAGQEQKLGLLLDSLGRAELHFADRLLRQQVLLRQVSATEERRHAIEMVLLPIGSEWMVVALRTTDIHAEEQTGGVVGQVVNAYGARFHERQRGPLLFVILVADQHVAEHDVPGAVLLNGP